MNKKSICASLDAPAPIYRQSQPSMLNSLALQNEGFDKDFGESFNSLAQNDSRQMIQRWMRILNGHTQQMSESEVRMSKFFLLSAFYPKVNIKTTDGVWNDFVSQRGMVKDMIEFLDWRISNVKPLRTVQFSETSKFLDLHCTYNAKQISAAIGRSGGVIMSGTDYNSERNLDSFFITIRKPEAEFSPTTMYHDYAKSPAIFHWETPGRTTVSSSEGQRYLKNLSKKMLFIRHTKKVKLDVTGQYDIASATSYYTFLGPVKNVLQYEGEKPIGIDFEMEYALPADVYEYARGA